jgi:glycosyltransferase involved in cell wall biosynthesis
MALADRGMLARYVTGVPAHRDAGGWMVSRLLRQKAEAYVIPVDPSLVKHLFVAPVVRKVSRVFGIKWSHAAGHVADGLFDRCVCGLLRDLRPEVVVAYENSALRTFRCAKQLGVKTVLDAASVHHRWQDRFCSPVEGTRMHGLITRHKDEEIKLADQLLTVSDFARESYLEAGVPRERVHTIPVGVDVARFRPVVKGTGSDASANREVRFVYVGNASPLKGLDMLRDAVGRLRASGFRFSATLIGTSGVSASNEPADGLVRMGWMSHERLAEELPKHDVLVLPSYFDSFGMVVAEAMACGLPAIVTDKVGAKEMVTPALNGFVVPARDAAALADAMKWFIMNRYELPHLSRAARESAERYDWANYRRRVTEFFAAL